MYKYGIIITELRQRKCRNYYESKGNDIMFTTAAITMTGAMTAGLFATPFILGTAAVIAVGFKAKKDKKSPVDVCKDVEGRIKDTLSGYGLDD